jgi:hypothetical protein
MRNAILLAVGLGLLAGCASQPMNTFSGQKNPEWVDKGGGAFKDADGTKVLYGVGTLQNVRNLGLARQAVDNRAIADIGKTIQVYSTQLMRDYASSINAGGKGQADEEQMIESTVKTFSQVTLSGVTIVDHFVDHKNNAYFALARLDLEGFKKAVENANQLNEAVKDYVRKNAEKAFDRLEAEEAKHSAQ